MLELQKTVPSLYSSSLNPPCNLTKFIPLTPLKKLAVATLSFGRSTKLNSIRRVKSRLLTGNTMFPSLP